MSSTPEQLSPDLYVVRPAAAQAQVAGLARLQGKASVTPLSGRLPGWVVKLNTLPRSAREGWRALHRLLGTDYLVMPALIDDTGHYRYPTGLLSLRLEDEASEQQLQSLATQYGLEFVARAKFTRQQALFRPADNDVFLPDLSDRLETDDSVEAVWFDAESAFQRG